MRFGRCAVDRHIERGSSHGATGGLLVECGALILVGARAAGRLEREPRLPECFAIGFLTCRHARIAIRALVRVRPAAITACAGEAASCKA